LYARVFAPGTGRLMPSPILGVAPSSSHCRAGKSATNKLDGDPDYIRANSKRAMDWLQKSVTPERELKIELLARGLEPREAYLFKTLISYQEMLQSAVHHIMKLEFELEDIRSQNHEPPQTTQSTSPHQTPQ
jgi:hypothetical protein